MFSKFKSIYIDRLDVKLTLYYTLIVLLLSVLLCIFFFYRLQHNLTKQLDRMLQDEAYELVHGIEEALGESSETGEYFDDGALVRGCQLYDQDTEKRKFYPVVFKVATTAGKLLYISQRAAQCEFPMIQGRSNHVFTAHIGPGNQSCRVLEKKIASKKRDGLILQMAIATQQSDKILENLVENILQAVPALLLVCIACGMLAARRPRRILRQITTVTKRVTSRNLSERLPVPAARDETRELAITINSMMDRLEKSFNDLKQFTADVSHELRNPLFALKGEMEVALSANRDRVDYQESLQECMERVGFLINMVNQLLLIARFDAQKIVLELDYVNAGLIIRDVYDFYLPMAQEKQIDLAIDKCDDVVIMADKTRLSQLAGNLLDNAIKFTPEKGSVRIILAGEPDRIVLMIRDSGIGIPPDDISKTFNRFYQADPARSGSGRGTGLGLHICKRIVEAHDGTITAEANKDRGMTFTVTLPLKN